MMMVVQMQGMHITKKAAIFRGLNSVDGISKIEPPKATGHPPTRKRQAEQMK